MNINELLEIIKIGKLYYPTNNNIICDRCHKNNLDVCIGYNNKDLCLPCADILEYQMNGNKIINDTILTRMEQDIYKKESIIIDNICLTSFPCKHRVIINNDNTIFEPFMSGEMMDGKMIANKYWKYLTNKQKKHFETYLDKKNIFFEQWYEDFYKNKS